LVVFLVGFVSVNDASIGGCIWLLAIVGVFAIHLWLVYRHQPPPLINQAIPFYFYPFVGVVRLARDHSTSCIVMCAISLWLVFCTNQSPLADPFHLWLVFRHQPIPSPLAGVPLPTNPFWHRSSEFAIPKLTPPHAL
jgi:hypothetical protein